MLRPLILERQNKEASPKLCLFQCPTLFILGLFNDSVHTIQLQDDWLIMDRKIYVRKQSWPNLRFCSGSFLSKTMKNLCVKIPDLQVEI